MLSTSSASAACQAARRSSTVVACGCSCTPTLNASHRRQASDRRRSLVPQLDAATAVAQHERRLALQQPLQRRAHEIGAPARSRAGSGGPASSCVELGARREHGGVEVELRRALREPRADHRDRRRQRPVDAIRLRHLRAPRLEREPGLDRGEEILRGAVAQCAPSTPRIDVSSSRLRGGRCTMPASARSEST